MVRHRAAGIPAQAGGVTLTTEEAAAMLTVTLGAIAEAAAGFPLDRRQEAARGLLARAAEADGSAVAEAYRAAARTILGKDA